MTATRKSEKWLTPRRTELTTFNSVTGGVAGVTTTEAGPGGVTMTGQVIYSYDPATGRKLSASTASTAETFGYDPLGRLSTVTASKLRGAAANVVTTYTYDPAGNLDTVTRPNGVSSDYVYDALNRLTDLSVKKGTTLLFGQHYVLESDGQKDSVTETRPSGTTFIDWTYDALDRLTGESRDEGMNGETAGTHDYTALYAFDLANNRVKKEQSGYQAAETDYVYDARDELTSETINATAYSYTYDANGSQTTKTHAGGSVTDSTYTWDLSNRMTAATVGAVSTSYTYDSSGLRVTQTTVTGTTQYVYDTANFTGYAKPVEEKNAAYGVTTVSYVLGLTVEAQNDATNGSLYLIHDGRGTTRALANPAGVIDTADALDFDTLGNAINFDAATAKTTWLAADGREDRVTGNRYNLSRDLVETTGLWTSQDGYLAPVGDWTNANLHLYAGSNSVGAVDPTGYFTVVELGVTIGVIGLLATIGYVAYSRISGAAKITRLQSDVQQAVVALSSGNRIDKPTPNLLPAFNTTLDVGDSTFGPSLASPPGSLAPPGTLVVGPGNGGPIRAPAYFLPYSGSSMTPQPYIPFVAQNNGDAPVLVYNRGAFDELNRRQYLGKERQTNDMSKIAIFVQEGWQGTSAGNLRSHWIAKYAGTDSGIAIDHRYSINLDVQSFWMSTGSSWQSVTAVRGPKPLDLNGAPY